jgi:uncharacterized membrane protein YjgN (DUF898 family)
MSVYYNVVYKGRILEGFDFEGAKNKLIEKFALSREKAEKILKGRRVVLKKAVDEITARKLGLALKRAGLDVILTKSPMSPAIQPETAADSKSPDPHTEKRPAATDAINDDHLKTVAATPAVDQALAKNTKDVPLEFHGKGGEYFKIWTVNIILSILTLGIYSAWAKVRNKKYIYGSSQLNGAGFEFLADPAKILKGRMIAGVFLVLYSTLSNLFPQIGFVFTLGLLAIVPWIVVKALTFNARNSAWRNIHFGFSGSIKEAAKAFFLWPILVPLTLGILAPYTYYRQRKFIIENSSYGTTSFTFNATARDYYRLFMSAFIPLITGIGLVAMIVFFLPPLAIPAALLLYLYLFAFYSVKTTNLQFNAAQLAAHQFKANLKIKEYLMLVITNSLATALTLGLFYPWAKIRTLRYKLSHISLIASGDIDTFVADEQKQVSSLGEEMGDFFDVDIGL